MATARQEHDLVSSGISPDALRQVEGYIEKIEKQSERGEAFVPNGQGQAQIVTSSQASTTGTQTIASSPTTSGMANITLPLTEEELKSGLHSKIAEGIRWLSEWCLMTIKKYPGRVFYTTG